MPIDDRMRRAAADARAAVARTSHEPIGTVRRRAAMQRIMAFGLGAIVVLAGVGAVAMAGGSGDTVLVPPAGEATTSTTTTTPTTTTVAPVATSAAPETTSTTLPTVRGDGLSDVDALRESFVEENATLLLAIDGLGIAATPYVELDGVWYFRFSEPANYETRLAFGPDFVEGEMIDFIMWLLVDQESPTITVYGVAPLGVTELALPIVDANVASDGSGPVIRIDEFYQRPEVGRSVFVGEFDAAILTEATPPVRFDPWIVTPAEVEIDTRAIFESFGLQSGQVCDSCESPITADIFLPTRELLAGELEVDLFPEVLTCEGANGVGRPPNQGRTIENGEVFPTPRAAFEAIMRGELGDSWFPHSGYLELTDLAGNIAYGAPPDWGTLDDGVVTLINIVAVGDGWTISHWEASGC